MTVNAVVLQQGSVKDAESIAATLGWRVQGDYAGLNAAIVINENGIALWSESAGSFVLDFVQGAYAWRMQHQQGKNELLVKAVCGKKKLPDMLSQSPRVIDVTAGLGRDALLLANLGFQVSLSEREFPLYLLLQQALRRLALEQPALAARMQLFHIDWMQTPHTQIEAAPTVYCDPMFPERQKSAKVKKEAQILQAFAHDEEDEVALWNGLMALSTQKMIVKRPLKAPCLAEKKPAHSVAGKTIRYDIYLA